MPIKSYISQRLIGIAFLFISIVSIAQKDTLLPNITANTSGGSGFIGYIKGKTKDSVYNFMLTNATIAVYKDIDTSLLKYTLPDNLGEFAISRLPVNMPLRLIITHIGYKALSKQFTLTPNNSGLDFGLLHLQQFVRDSNGNMMEEVVVKSIPPMTMSGDTIIFNPDAFRMDSNATTEDLIRSLPGMTIWGDGDITYNGKKIQKVLVEGKPFMGTNDITVATQNLPKNALDQVQVYQQHNDKNPLDSNMFVNLKLKKDKQIGYFGKISGGYGISPPSISKEKRYAIDGMLSGYNKKLQVTTVGAFNNVNKLAKNVDVLLKNSSYKGTGTSLEYQSDYNMRGLNKPAMGGARLQYDFITDVKYNKSSRLNMDYFINHNNTNVINTNLEKNFLLADTILSRQSNSASFNRSNDQQANARYEHIADKFLFNISTSGYVNEDNYRYQSSGTQEKTGVGVINRNSSASEIYRMKQGMNTGFSFTKRESIYRNRESKRIPSEFTVGYNFSAGNNKGNAQSQTTYEFSKEPQRNRNVSRLSDRQNSDNSAHNFFLSYPRLKELILGEKSLGGINLELSAKYDLSTGHSTDQIRDLDTATGAYVANSDLSYSRTIGVENFMPAIGVSWNFNKGLTNRYNKSVAINLSATEQYYSHKSISTQTVQTLNYYYKNFVPSGSITYNNHQYGSYEAKYSLNYNSSVEYPNINQIAPLVDRANPFYLPMGNRNLKPEYRQSIGFKYTFTTRTAKNPWNVELNIAAGKTKDNIADSTLYDNGGGRTVYITNINGNKYLNSGVNVRKSLAINKHHTFELATWYNYNLSNDPRYINTQLNVSFNRIQGGGFNINYRHRDALNIKLEQGVSYSNAEQRGFNNIRFRSSNQYLRAIATVQFPKNLVWSSNITYNRNTAGDNDAINFTIWNASLTYRFLKGNNGEVKFSALDLLQQNKGITNSINGAVQNFGYTNVLQQYFMLSLSYYPRKFGK